MRGRREPTVSTGRIVRHGWNGVWFSVTGRNPTSRQRLASLVTGKRVPAIECGTRSTRKANRRTVSTGKFGAKRFQSAYCSRHLAVTVVVAASLWIQVRSAPAFRETAVIPSLLRADPHIAHFETFLRKDLDGTHSLLLVLGSQRPSLQWLRWSPGDTIGLFLIKNSDPDLVWDLAIASSNDDFHLEVECVSSNSVVWSRTIGDYGMPSDSIKTYFDISSKKVLRRFEFSPIGARRILAIDGNLYFSLFTSTIPSARWAEAPFARLVRDEPVLVTRSETRELLSLFAEASNTDIQRYHHELQALPQSSLMDFARARTDIAQSTRGSAQVELNEEIGPSQLVGDRLWFGKTFYDGEGLSGVGGFGYFDPQEQSFVEFSPPEIWQWSASALLVEDGVVWIGRFRRPEGASYSGGLLRYDLKEGEVSEFDVGEIIRQIKRWGGKLYIASDGGIYVMDELGRIDRYVFEPALGGETTAFHCEQ